MAERFSLKDHLFNRDTLETLAAEYAAGVPGFDAARFLAEVLPGLEARKLLQRLDWIADCIETQLSPDFNEMAAQLEAAMVPPLDPSLRDDDFGQFIHAVPGILAVRHGLESHRDRALDLIYRATQRFSMEFYIRPFLNRWPEQTLARLSNWAGDDNYHVRRLVSEGTRPRLPWAKAVTIGYDATLPLLDRLHGDSTRYVTRSVANHLNDIAKKHPDLVLDRLQSWSAKGAQDPRELAWMTRHGLRTLVKQGHPGALKALGYDPDAPLRAGVMVAPGPVQIGDILEFTVNLLAPSDTPVLVDYAIWFAKPDGSQVPRVFKLKQTVAKAGAPLILVKTHRLKGDATTFRLHPGAHRVVVQVNGRVVAEDGFEVLA